VGKPEEKKQLEDLSLGGRVILKLILKGWDGGGRDWINVAWDTCHWRAVVNSVISIVYQNMRAISRLDEKLVASREGLSFSELSKPVDVIGVGSLPCWTNIVYHLMSARLSSRRGVLIRPPTRT
jgi:hypothetical protein